MTRTKEERSACSRTLPPNLPPRLLSRDQAAEYCGGISTPHFIETIGLEVPPIEVGKRKFWDRRALDHYLDVQSGLIEGGAFLIRARRFAL